MMTETLKKKIAKKGNTLGWYALGIPINMVFSREEEEEEKEEQGNNEDEDEETGESASASGRKGG